MNVALTGSLFEALAARSTTVQRVDSAPLPESDSPLTPSVEWQDQAALREVWQRLESQESTTPTPAPAVMAVVPPPDWAPRHPRF